MTSDIVADPAEDGGTSSPPKGVGSYLSRTNGKKGGGFNPVVG